MLPSFISYKREAVVGRHTEDSLFGVASSGWIAYHLINIVADL
ncbi:hypothetical protein [Paenibacillus sp. DCT19]|nr:hypothetical protein [Paenibacillus sp. DCT19]